MTKQQTEPYNVAIIGGGPAGLMAAETIMCGAGQTPVRVTIYESMPSPARKFLMAGRGGLNITHSEDYERFVTRYGEAAPQLRAALDSFTPDNLRNWCEMLGEPTFTGSSGRVFPKSFKASPLLRAWLRRLADQGVTLKTRHRWLGWNEDGSLRIATPEGEISVQADATVLALGGASWPKLGSDGAWVDVLKAQNVAIAPLKAANVGATVAWSELFRDRHAGQPLKRMSVTVQDATARGELIVTKDGLEGGALYALSNPLRAALENAGVVPITLALRPDMPGDKIESKLRAPRGKQSLSNFLRKALSLSATEIALLNEAAIAKGQKLAAMDATQLASFVNAVPLRVTGMGGLARAISTAGGVSFAGLGPELALSGRPDTFFAGEMLDWEAPTGGYLLTATMATGALAGRGVLQLLALSH